MNRSLRDRRYFFPIASEVDLIDGEPRITLSRFWRFMVPIEDMIYARSLPMLNKQIKSDDEIGAFATREYETDPDPKTHETHMVTSIWLTEAQCIVALKYEPDIAMRPIMADLIRAGFAKAESRISEKRKKMSETGRSVSSAIADASERIGCSTSSIYSQVKNRFGSSKNMPPETIVDAIDWLDALSEKSDLKKPA